MNSEVEDIKSRLPIREVIGGYIQLTKAGTSWKGLCPFHHEKSPSFIVNEERLSWHCFGCGKGGDVFSFVMEIDGLSFPEALALLAERAGVSLVRRVPSTQIGRAGNIAGETSAVKTRIFEALDLASKFFEKQLWDGIGTRLALPYLRSRGISDEFLRLFRIGFSLPGWRTLLDFLVRRGYSMAELETAGLVVRKTESIAASEGESAAFLRGGSSGNLFGYDRFRDRITFPVFDISGRVIGFSARVLPGASEESAKYINTPETPVYHKSNALYGLFQAKRALRDTREALFVEGNMDVIAMHQIGFSNTVAVSGTALTEEQLRIVLRFGDSVKLFFDMDSAGQKAARKSAELALSLGLSVSIVGIEGGKDAAELARENVESLRQSIANAIPAPEYFLRSALREHDAKTAEGKRRIAEDMASLLRFVSRDIEKFFWVKTLSERIGVPEELLVRMMSELLSGPYESLEASRLASPKNPSIQDRVFELGSDRILKEIAGILLAFPSLLPMPLESAGDRVLSAISRSGILTFLSGESAESFSFAGIPADLKSDAAKLAFLGEKLAGAQNGAETVDLKSVREIFLTLWRRLDLEVRRETMRDIERLMRVARDKGDAAEELRLARELVLVGSDEANVSLSAEH